MLHGGDFLFPSFASRMYQGMFVTLGNHEFDQTRLRKATLLTRRIDESQFRWLTGNITFGTGPDGQPLVASRNLSRTAIVESGGIRIGIFGLTTPTFGVEYVADFAGEQASARKLIAELRAQKAEVIVALTPGCRSPVSRSVTTP